MPNQILTQPEETDAPVSPRDIVDDEWWALWPEIEGVRVAMWEDKHPFPMIQAALRFPDGFVAEFSADNCIPDCAKWLGKMVRQAIRERQAG